MTISTTMRAMTAMPPSATMTTRKHRAARRSVNVKVRARERCAGGTMGLILTARDRIEGYASGALSRGWCDVVAVTWDWVRRCDVTVLGDARVWLDDRTRAASVVAFKARALRLTFVSFCDRRARR